VFVALPALRDLGAVLFVDAIPQIFMPRMGGMRPATFPRQFPVFLEIKVLTMKTFSLAQEVLAGIGWPSLV
jgi:hypothetical protein